MFTEEFRGTMSWNGFENKVLLRNEGPGPDGTPRFVDVAMALGADLLQDARGYASLDFDGDGDLDLALNHNAGDTGRPEAGQARLLRNDVGDRYPWLLVAVEGRGSNRDGVGAVVTVEAGGLAQVRRVEAGSGYASQHTAWLHFGLGTHERVDRLRVRWPSGREESYDRPLAARQRLRLVEGHGLEVLPSRNEEVR
jgi:hypothetical protein